MDLAGVHMEFANGEKEEVIVVDGRQAVNTLRPPSLDKEGFTLLEGQSYLHLKREQVERLQPPSVSHLPLQGSEEEHFLTSMTQSISQACGSPLVIPTHLTHSNGSEGDEGKPVAECSSLETGRELKSLISCPEKVQMWANHFGVSTACFSKGRVISVSCYRNIADNGPIESSPLALLDDSSVAKPEDLCVSEDGSSYSLKPSSCHRWYYFPKLAAYEAVVFKNSDSCPNTGGRMVIKCPIHLPDYAYAQGLGHNKAVLRRRASCELRALVFYPNNPMNSIANLLRPVCAPKMTTGLGAVQARGSEMPSVILQMREAAPVYGMNPNGGGGRNRNRNKGRGRGNGNGNDAPSSAAENTAPGDIEGGGTTAMVSGGDNTTNGNFNNKLYQMYGGYGTGLEAEAEINKPSATPSTSAGASQQELQQQGQGQPLSKNQIRRQKEKAKKAAAGAGGSGEHLVSAHHDEVITEVKHNGVTDDYDKKVHDTKHWETDVVGKSGVKQHITKTSDTTSEVHTTHHTSNGSPSPKGKGKGKGGAPQGKGAPQKENNQNNNSSFGPPRDSFRPSNLQGYGTYWDIRASTVVAPAASAGRASFKPADLEGYGVFTGRMSTLVAPTQKGAFKKAVPTPARAPAAKNDPNVRVVVEDNKTMTYTTVTKQEGNKLVTYTTCATRIHHHRDGTKTKRVSYHPSEVAQVSRDTFRPSMLAGYGTYLGPDEAERRITQKANVISELKDAAMCQPSRETFRPSMLAGYGTYWPALGERMSTVRMSHKNVVRDINNAAKSTPNRETFRPSQLAGYGTFWAPDEWGRRSTVRKSQMQVIDEIRKIPNKIDNAHATVAAQRETFRPSNIAGYGTCWDNSWETDNDDHVQQAADEVKRHVSEIHNWPDHAVGMVKKDHSKRHKGKKNHQKSKEKMTNFFVADQDNVVGLRDMPIVFKQRVSEKLVADPVLMASLDKFVERVHAHGGTLGFGHPGYDESNPMCVEEAAIVVKNTLRSIKQWPLFAQTWVRQSVSTPEQLVELACQDPDNQVGLKNASSRFRTKVCQRCKDDHGFLTDLDMLLHALRLGAGNFNVYKAIGGGPKRLAIGNQPADAVDTAQTKVQKAVSWLPNWASQAPAGLMKILENAPPASATAKGKNDGLMSGRGASQFGKQFGPENKQLK